MVVKCTLCRNPINKRVDGIFSTFDKVEYKSYGKETSTEYYCENCTVEIEEAIRFIKLKRTGKVD